MPIQYNVVLVDEGRENDGKENRAFLTCTSLAEPIYPHRVVVGINEAVEPTISLKVIIDVLQLKGADIQNGIIANKYLDEELASLPMKMNGRVKITEMGKIK